MAGYSNFQVSRNKTRDVNNRNKNLSKTQENLSKNEKLRNGFKKWTSFYRANMHRFVEEYFGIRLKLFQKILLFLMNNVLFFMYLAARGQGKSFIIAVYCCARSVLYPNTKIILASGTKGQAKLIISQKIEKDLFLNYPNLAREIKNIKSSNNECVVYFHNGSTIEAVTSTDNARGYRGNILILDEFRLIKESNLKEVLQPFLNVNRQPKYLNKPEYAHLQEENIEIYISSAWYKNHWIWDKFKSFRDLMVKGESYFACALPYQLSLFHGLLSKKRAEQIRKADDFDPISWMMEYDCLFFGESENAFFKLLEIEKCRTNVKPFYPMSSLEYLQNKDKRKKSTKQSGEIRLIGVDVAMMGGNDNDNTVFTLMRLLPNGENYIRQVPYIETMSGQHSHTQAVRLKQLYNDFEADYVVMDTAGNGLSLYDDCSKILYDEERDVEYPAWSAMNNEEMKNRALDKNAIPIIYSIKVVRAELNHEIAVNLRSVFEKRLIKLLVNDIQGREFLEDKHGYALKTPEEQANLIKPYIQTTALVNEMVNLEYEIRGGFVKLKEVGKNRKDRYSSLAYANYFARQLEIKNLKKQNTSTNPNDFFFMRKPKIYK
jgi:hypothetical protein